ncbi:hypothetical protein MCEMIE22_03207 [Mycobacteriaceae bacterium]
MGAAGARGVSAAALVAPLVAGVEVWVAGQVATMAVPVLECVVAAEPEEVAMQGVDWWPGLCQITSP